MNAQRARKLRVWIEAALTAISAVMVVLTVAARDWIEQIFDSSPDHGSGETEWVLTAAAVVAALAFASITALEWRRLRSGPDPT